MIAAADQRQEPTVVTADGRETVESLFRAFQRPIGRYLVQMVRDRSLAEDLLQETFQDALQAREQLAEVRNPQAWLYGIARNRALRALRSHRRFQRALTRLGREVSEQTDSDAALVVVQDLLDRTLAPDRRALVLLRYLHGFEAVELAAMTGLSPEVVRQRLSRARARLLAAAQPGSAAGKEQP